MSTLVAYHFGACWHSLDNCFFALKYAPCCKQHVCITCFAYIFLTVTPFGVIFICNVISFSCRLCWCECLLLLTNLKCGLGKNSNKLVNHRAVLSDMPCLGLHLT